MFKKFKTITDVNIDIPLKSIKKKNIVNTSSIYTGVHIPSRPLLLPMREILQNHREQKRLLLTSEENTCTGCIYHNPHSQYCSFYEQERDEEEIACHNYKHYQTT